MKTIKEKDLLKLGFERMDVGIEESGDKAYYYFTFDIGDLCLISNSNDECVNGNYGVEIFEYNTISFNDLKSLKKLIDLFLSSRKLNDE